MRINIQLKDLERDLITHKIYNTNAPILSYCRLLMKLGENPCTSLHVYRDDVLAIKVRTIEEGSKLTIKDKHGTPVFTKYTIPKNSE